MFNYQWVTVSNPFHGGQIVFLRLSWLELLKQSLGCDGKTKPYPLGIYGYSMDNLWLIYGEYLDMVDIPSGND